MSFQHLFSFLTLFCFLSLTVWAQSKTVSADVQLQLKKELQQMLTAEQSGTTNPKQTDKQKAANKVKSNQVFTAYFYRLLAITRQYGFPSNALLGNDLIADNPAKSIDATTSLVLKHIAQSQPHLLFDSAVITLFADELQKGNLKRDLLTGAMTHYATAFKPCNTDKPIVEEALSAWKLNYNINNIDFQSCW